MALPAESEVFVSLLIRTTSDGEIWLRVLAMEIVRGLCADALLMRALFLLGSGEAFGALLGALNRLAREKPAMLGSSPQLYTGGGVSEDGMISLGSVVGATVSGVVGMLGGENAPGLSDASAMKVQWCVYVARS